MAKKISASNFVKKLIKQISGNVTEEDELIPEIAIDGTGEIWCWDPTSRTHKRLHRGVKAYIIQENFDDFGRALIYTVNGDMICIEPEDIVYTGYD